MPNDSESPKPERPERPERQGHEVFLEAAYLQAVLASEDASNKGLEEIAEVFARKVKETGEELIELGIDPREYLEEQMSYLQSHLDEQGDDSTKEKKVN